MTKDNEHLVSSKPQMLSNIMFWEKKCPHGLKIWQSLSYKLSLNPSKNLWFFFEYILSAICLGLTIVSTLLFESREVLYGAEILHFSLHSCLHFLKWFVFGKVFSHYAPLYINILTSWKFIHMIKKKSSFPKY